MYEEKEAVAPTCWHEQLSLGLWEDEVWLVGGEDDLHLSR